MSASPHHMGSVSHSRKKNPTVPAPIAKLNRTLPQKVVGRVPSSESSCSTLASVDEFLKEVQAATGRDAGSFPTSTLVPSRTIIQNLYFI